MTDVLGHDTKEEHDAPSIASFGPSCLASAVSSASARPFHERLTLTIAIAIMNGNKADLAAMSVDKGAKGFQVNPPAWLSAEILGQQSDCISVTNSDLTSFPYTTCLTCQHQCPEMRVSRIQDISMTPAQPCICHSYCPVPLLTHPCDVLAVQGKGHDPGRLWPPGD